MWALIVERVVEFALALMSAIKSVSAAVLQWRAIELGQSEGRAESDAAHEQASREAGDRMQSIADKPASREEIIQRLEEGSA